MKKFLKLTMVLVLVFFSGVNVSAKSGDEAYSYLKLIDEKYQKRIAGSSMEKDMANYISDELVSFGYSTKKEDFSFTRGGKQVDSQNIVAIKKGKSTKQIIVGAHYDSVGTNGVDDNGSGVSLTLESAKKLANTNMDYTIVFVFFGSEEVGLQGSKAYVNAMSQNEIDNTILMVNIDSVLSGTYPYIYGGEFKDNKIVDKWGVEQGMELSKELGLDLRTNDTKLNYHYPTPTTGNWSDHASFKKVGIPHIYLEASNWEVLDDVNNPGEGSSGASESEIGAIMHVPSRDNLSFINQEFPGRAQSNLSTYSSFLINYLQRVSQSGL
ncbi:MAG: M20/M25/M40 family metallo-hydrolase [Erysipelotrichales bacterium]